MAPWRSPGPPGDIKGTLDLSASGIALCWTGLARRTGRHSSSSPRPHLFAPFSGDAYNAWIFAEPRLSPDRGTAVQPG